MKIKIKITYYGNVDNDGIPYSETEIIEEEGCDDPMAMMVDCYDYDLKNIELLEIIEK